jgi:hypothetical protein
MATLPDLAHTAATAAGISGLLYTTTIATVALTAAFANDPTRRADARATLTILLRRRPPDQ